MHALNKTLAGLAILATLAPLTVLAQTPSRQARCAVRIPSLEFGDYDVFDASPTRAATQITLDCVAPRDPDYSPKIELSAGSSQDFQIRTQRSGVNQLNYNIYVDPGRTRIAGDGTSGTFALYPEKVAGRNARIVNLYGAIDPHQLAPPGVYFDTVYVTITF